MLALRCASRLRQCLHTNAGFRRNAQSFFLRRCISSHQNGQNDTGAPESRKSKLSGTEDPIPETSASSQRIWGGVSWWKPIWDELHTIPNAITLSRLAATPFLAYLIVDQQYKLAFGGLVVFGFSDWLDGYIARNYNQTSVLGTFLDPFADKVRFQNVLNQNANRRARAMQVLIATLAFVEGWNGLLPWPLVALIVGRDLGLIIGGFVVRAKTKPSGVPFFDTRQASALQVISFYLHARRLTSLWPPTQIKPSTLSKVNTLLQVNV